jgi:hypothetical protein
MKPPGDFISFGGFILFDAGHPLKNTLKKEVKV